VKELLKWVKEILSRGRSDLLRLEGIGLLLIVGLALEQELLHVVSWFLWRMEVWLAVGLELPEPPRYPAGQPIATWHLIIIVIVFIVGSIALMREFRER
jgi:hypothetical protein